MMIKAIFFDIDGTLVSFKTHKIPESTIQALHTLKAKGIKLFIATGRPPYDLKFLIDEFGIYSVVILLLMVNIVMIVQEKSYTKNI